MDLHTQTFDLFWRPSPGELVMIRPGSHPGRYMTPTELSHPLRVVKDAGDIDGMPMLWCSPTWPVRTYTNRNGRVITETPASQRPLCVDDIMPATPNQTAKRRPWASA